MKSSILTLSMALAALLANSAMAQSRGEADPDQYKATPAKPATQAEKVAARKARLAAGKDVSRTATSADDAPNNAGMARTVSKSDRQAAQIKRKAETSEALKRGEGSSGEK
jgi:Flp pilus assembly protein CpaB